MTQLSPAAQAVRIDTSKIWRRLQSHCKVDYCPRNPLAITIETSPAGLETVINNLVSAALCAAADQVVPVNGSRKNNEIRAELLAIATELEAQ
jgi:hypothetical protein